MGTCGWSCAPNDHLQSSFWMGTPWPVKFQLPATAAAVAAAKYCPSPSPVTSPGPASASGAPKKVGDCSSGTTGDMLRTLIMIVVLVLVLVIAVALVFIANKLRTS